MKKFIMNKRGKGKSRRIYALLLCLCVLITAQPEIWSRLQVLAAEAPQASGSIALKRISGSGNAFIYYNFKETTAFQPGKTYAFLNGIYGAEDAVAALGSGAILSATNKNNGSLGYIKGRYGDSAGVKVYVDVVTKGKDFDGCKIGGLYQVPGTSNPTEYRYFCGYGGAQNCGPYYAYTYDTAQLSYENVSASLKDIEKQGSDKSEDYIVTLTYEGKTITLDTGSYSVQVADPDSDAVTIVVSDSQGNTISTKFQGPLAVRFEGNAEGVAGIPDMQAAWKGQKTVLTGNVPTRAGYSFVNWKDKTTGTTYTKGQTISSFGSKSLQLLAQWKDTQKPDFTYAKPEVLIRTTNSEVEQIIKAALTITDNEPVSECSVKATMENNLARSVGDKQVTVTVTDKAGNATTKTVIVTVIALSLELGTPVFTEGTKTLSADMLSPGGDTITETGFVWGIMTSPTLTLNNGKQKTASPVTAPDAKISVTAGDIQKGVTYYARAYAIAGGLTYYSDEISFGLGVPAYGTFTIKNNNNNTFTVTRTGGSEGAQTVYYRTVNGSAVGGTHFTHKADTLTFAAGETSKTITITEQGVNTAYTGSPATAYTNANRTYSVELYRVTGGGTLGNTVSAGRTMTAGSGYKVNRSNYTTEKSIVNVAEASKTDGKRIADTTSGQGGTTKNVSFLTNRYDEQNYNTSTAFSSYYTNANERTYLEKTASGWYYRYDLYAYEYEDGYEHAYMGTKALEDTNYSLSGTDAAVKDIAGQLWACNFLQGERDDAKHYYFPDTRTGGGESAGYPKNSNGSAVSYNGKTYVDLKVSDTCYVYFGSTGANTDIWYIDGLTSYAIVYDNKEPQLVAVAPMAGGLYKAGDSFTVSLIFDEIVDSTNSVNLSNVRVNTNWGEAAYVGGADTNVLYFSGTVKADASGNLSVTGITNTGNIKDMCNAAGTACSSKTGNTTASVDTAQPAFTLTSKGVAGGTGTVNVIVNTDKTKTNSLRYAWSDSTSMPVTGWVEASASELVSAKGTSGLSLSIRKDAGSGANNGKWYLHVIGTYDTTGATAYKYAEVNFGTAANPISPAPSVPTLSLSTDNSKWATSRTINITKTNETGCMLQYRKVGTSSWTTLTLSASLKTVEENGWYTFRLKNNDYIVTKDILVEKIDKINPTAAVGTLVENGTDETEKNGVYTKITLPVIFADIESGVKTVQYQWTNTQTTPMTDGWKTLSLSAAQLQSGTAQLSYTATESSETNKYLHIKVTDNVGNSYTVKSAASTVISQTAVNNHAPKITLTGAPTAWINDTATLAWQLTNYSGKNYEVILPNGQKARANVSTGEVWALQNGTYTVKVRDLDYGGENSAIVTVSYIDTTAPTVSVSEISDKWQKSGQTVTISASDSQSGVGKKYYKIVTTDEEIPTEGLTELTTNSVSVEQDGIYYLYYKIYDQTGDDTVGREANKTEGFVGPIQIDAKTPTLTLEAENTGIPKDQGLTVSVTASYGASGGNTKVNNEVIAALTAEAENTDESIEKQTEYKVESKGNYTFSLTAGSGKTASKSLTVYEAEFDLQGGTASVSPQLVVSGGTLTEPDSPQREGYAFAGWYTAATGGSKWDFTTDQVTSDNVAGGKISLYARWLDGTPPDKPVLQDGVTLPVNWTNTENTIPLKLSGSRGIAELWVSTDGGTYQKVEGFTGSAGDKPCNYEYPGVMEGEHTYRFKAKDTAGNESAESDIFTVKLDTTKPALGAVTYENKAANLWQWIIGKKNLIVYVPVADTGSGVTEISFCLTPRKEDGTLDSDNATTKTAAVSDSGAKIIFDADFRGTITINCEDQVGNAADSVMIGEAAGGIIVENNKPEITFAVNGDEVSSSEYEDTPEIIVTVKDNKDNAISSGIVSVKYTIGSGSEKAVDHDYTTVMAVSDSFTIPASEIPMGETVITVTAADHAGNSVTATQTIKVKVSGHTHSGTLVPAKAAACTEDGNQAYYICSCGKWFSDSTCINQITDHASVIVEMLGHDFSGRYQFDEKRHWKVCSHCGEAEPKEAHVYDSDTDTDCNQCAYRRTIENPGNVSKDVEKDEKAPATVLSTSAKELADIILTEEEKGQVKNGTDIKFILDVKDAGDTVNSSDKAAVQEALNGFAMAEGFAVGQYLDISLFKVIGAERSAISQTSKKLTIVIDVPDSLRSRDSGKPRTYAVIRVHDRNAEWLADLDDNTDTITIATDRFSAYAIVYKEAGSGQDIKPSPTPDEKGDGNVTPTPTPTGKKEKASGKEKRKIEIHSGLKVIQTGKKLQISWGRVNGADGYSVYVQYCGKDFGARSRNQIRSGKKTKITVRKVNGKKLDTTKNFKLYVVAWQWKNGKKSTLTKTLTIHIAGKDSVMYTNVESIQVKKNSYTLKKGGTVTLRPKAVLYDKRKKQLSVNHTKEFRYLSSNKKVAKVTAGGKVKAKGTGECVIYIFAKNGCRRKIKIKVK